MKTYQRFVAILLVGLFMPFEHTVARAGLIQYAWFGRLIPNDANDPWQIGNQGRAFVLDVAVSCDAPDLLDLNIEFAAYEAQRARLLIEGHEIPYVGSALIDFTDDWSELADIVVFHGVFTRYDQTVELGVNAVLPTTSFQLSKTIESPPLFPSTENLDRSVCCGGVYASVVSAGTPFMVAAEPASAAILAGGALVVMLTERRRQGFTLPPPSASPSR